MKRVRFKLLQLENFTTHREMTVNYGNITKLSGRNGQGKTSIGAAPVWIFYGTDLMGKTFNPSPVNYEYDHVLASLLMSVDGLDVKLAREISKGKNKYYINDVPVKETEFSEFLASVFDKEMFLSLYNPAFFFTQHKDKQREQLLKYILPPSNAEVLAEMSRTSPDQKQKDIPLNPQAAKLAEALKKHNIKQLADLHTDLKNKSDKLHIQSQGSVKTLTNQLQELGEPREIDESAIIEELDLLTEKINSFDADRKKVMDRDNEIRALHTKIDLLTRQIESGTNDYNAAVAQQIEENCSTCGQPLTDNAKAKAKDAKATEVRKHAERVNPLKRERKFLREQLANLQPIAEPDYSVSDLVARSNELNAILRSNETRTKAIRELEKAKKDEAAHLQDKNDSIFVLDAIKAFKAKEAEIQTAKVQSLFTTLSIRLFKYVKTRDEYEPDFMICMNDKDYTQLSLGEKVAAGLELQDVFYKQTELVVPCFVDNIESFTGSVKVFGQAILSRVIEDQDLRIEST